MASTEKLSKDSLGRVQAKGVTDGTVTEQSKGGFPHNSRQGANIKHVKGKGQRMALSKMY